jgi:hypothetical protein
MTVAESVIITLAPGELAVANVIASLRQAVNRTASITNLKAGPQDPMTTELVGIYGEFAFARYANVWPDLSIHLRNGSYDAKVGSYDIDVKSSRGYRWKVDPRPGKCPMFYVFAHVDYATVELMGWQDAATLQEHEVEWVLPEHLEPMQKFPNV